MVLEGAPPGPGAGRPAWERKLTPQEIRTIESVVIRFGMQHTLVD